MRRILALLTCLAAPATAQQAVPCDWPARADALVEPWEDHTSTFAKGRVRLALLDTIEPATAAFHILILSPPFDEVGGRQCMTLGLAPGMGFAGVDWPSLTAGYDPAVGLIWHVNVQVMRGAGAQTAVLRFTLNQTTGAISARLS